LSSIIKKVVVEHPCDIAQYLDSSYDAIRFGSACCLTSALQQWDVQTVKKTVEQISAAGKRAEFQTFILPHSREHIQYMDVCVKVLQGFSEDCMPLLVVSDIGFIDTPYQKKGASHFLKIHNREDVALLAEFGVSEVDIAPDSETSIEDVNAFLSGAREHGLRVGIVGGTPPIFLGWRCYFDTLHKREKCGIECKKTLIPLLSPSETDASFYVAGKSIYPVARLGQEWEKLSPDAIIAYVAKYQ